MDIDWWGHTVFTITPAGAATALYTNPNNYLSSPRGITRDPASGDFIIADDDLDAIFTLTPDGQVLSQIAQYGALGVPGAVIVADTIPQNAIDYVLTDSDPAAIVPVGGGTALNCSACSGFVSDFAIDGQGNFIVASEGALVKITPGSDACPHGCGILIPVNGQNFFSVAIDRAGNYIVGDNNNHQVLKVAPGSPATITASIPYTVNEVEGDSFEDVIHIDAAGTYVVAEDNDGDNPVDILVIPPTANSSPAPLTLTPGLPLTSIPTTFLGGMTLDATGRYVLTDDDNGQVYVASQAGAFNILYDNSGGVFNELAGIYLDPLSGNFLLTDYDTGGLYTMDQTGHQVNLVQSGLSNPVVALSYPTVLTVISSATLPGGTANQFYATGFLAQGGSGNYSWGATRLPGTLSMSAAGVISGTPTAAFSSNNIVVTVTDLSNNNGDGDEDFLAEHCAWFGAAAYDFGFAAVFGEGGRSGFHFDGEWDELCFRRDGGLGRDCVIDDFRECDATYGCGFSGADRFGGFGERYGGESGSRDVERVYLHGESEHGYDDHAGVVGESCRVRSRGYADSQRVAGGGDGESYVL